MIKIKNISDVITNSSSEVFIRKLKKSERMFLKSLRTKNIEEEKVANPDDPEEWYYIDSCGVDYHKVTKSWLLKEEDWDQIYRTVSIISFIQNIPIGLKYYNNYV